MSWKKELKDFIYAPYYDNKEQYSELESFIEKAIIGEKIKLLENISKGQTPEAVTIKVNRELKQLTCKHDGRTNPGPLGGIFCVECSCFVNKDKLEELKTLKDE